VKLVRIWWGGAISTYSLIAPDFRVVLDVANDVLAPDERVVVVGLEVSGNKVCPRFNRFQPFLEEHAC